MKNIEYQSQKIATPDPSLKYVRLFNKDPHQKWSEKISPLPCACLVICVISVSDGDTLCQNISEFLSSSLAVSLAQTGSCLFILCCLEGLATLAEKIPSLTR